MSDPERLRVARNEPWSVEKHNGTVEAVEAMSVHDSPDYYVSKMPGGTFIAPVEEGGGGGYVSPIFGVTAVLQKDSFLVRIARGFIGGVEPTIAETGKKISTGWPLTVSMEEFNEDGECGLYVRADLDRSWNILTVKALASKVKLGDGPWFGHDLLGVFVKQGKRLPRYERAAFSNKIHYVAQRRSNGIARNLFLMTA